MSSYWLLKTAIIGSVVFLAFMWGFAYRFNDIRLAIPTSRRLRELFQLSDPDRFRSLIPSDVFDRRRRYAIRESILYVSMVLTLALCSMLSSPIVEEVFLYLILAVYSIYVIVSIRRYRHRVVLLSLGVNSLDEDSGENSFQDLNRALRWFYLPLAIVAVIAFVQSPDQTYDLYGVVLAGSLAVLGFCTPAESQLCSTGLFQPASKTPWRSVAAYHWYAHRQGVVFVRDAGTLHSPLVILPVPEDKADEVERILDQYLPGKRGEDVDFSAEEHAETECAASCSEPRT